MLAMQAKSEPPSKIFIACSHCKARKRKCDGSTPKCSNCVAHNAECNYAAVRKTRGLGKKNKGNDNANLSPDEVIGSSRCPQDEEQVGLMITQPAAVDISNSGSSSLNVSPCHMGVKERLPIFPDFLLPGNFDRNLATFKSQLKEATAARRFYPLMPIHISRRLIGNTFTDMMAEHQLIGLSNFMELLEAQYIASTEGPAEDAARWALINAVVALAVRFKTAAGSESEISPVTQSFYQNAAMVVHQLILQDPTLLSIQALLAMAVFSRGVPDAQAFVMLTTNASHQLEIFGRRRFGENPMVLVYEADGFQQVYEVCKKLSEEASFML
ncbi:hypothetical protein F5Y12DRAFT_296027 [Xylaria sp. FL1777]|nr:hypothetical protein F5Y12DRAFT_296027 [Xylaria sp. FL1777]